MAARHAEECVARTPLGLSSSERERSHNYCRFYCVTTYRGGEGGEEQGVGAAAAAAAVTRESHKISISIGVRRFPRCAYPDPERTYTRARLSGILTYVE